MPTDSEASGSGSSSSGSDSDSRPASPAGSVSSHAPTDVTDVEMKSVKSNSRSRSGSPTSASASAPGSPVKSDVDVSPQATPRSRSKSLSKSPSRSKSRSKSRSRSKSKSKSRSRSKSKSKSKSRSRSKSAASNSSTSSDSSGPVLGRKQLPKVNFSSDDEEKEPAPKVQVKSSEVFGEMSSGSDDDMSVDGDKEKDREIRERDIAREGDGDRDQDDEDKDEAADAENSDEEKEKPMEVEEEEAPPETRIDVEIPKITTDLGKALHFVKLPNFLSVETRPFDPTTYEDEIDDEETLDEEGRARLKLKVENTIRWREKFNDKGVFIKESNARFVHWSDGSLSLHLGEEIFNVYKQPLQGDHNHLFIRQGTGLQGQAVFRTKLTFRPHSTESFTHRKMTMSLADRSTKTQGIKVLSVVGHDPEANRHEMIKKEEDKLRASVRRENKQRRVREKTSNRGLSASYLDDDYSDDDNAISISAIKNKYKKGVKANIYSSDEDEGSDLEQKRKLERAKRLKDSEEEDEDDDDKPKASTSAAAGGGDASGGEKDDEHNSD